MKASKFLTRARIPAFVSIFLLFAVEIVSQALRIAEPTTSLPTVGFAMSVIMYMIISITATVCFLVTATLVGKKLSFLDSELQRAKMHKVIYLTTTSSVGLLLFVVLLVMMSTPFYFWYPAAFYYISFSTYTVTTVISTVHCYSFEPPCQKGISQRPPTLQSVANNTYRSPRKMHVDPEELFST